MMHRSKKPLVSGNREYFNEKRPVNVRVEGTVHLAEALGSCPERGPRKFLLGHASVQTTEQYLGCKQKLRHAVNDNLGLEDV